jgi:hypothetical protein
MDKMSQILSHIEEILTVACKLVDGDATNKKSLSSSIVVDKRQKSMESNKATQSLHPFK